MKNAFIDSAILAPRWGAAHFGAAWSRGIGRLWLSFPRARLSKPVGPLPCVRLAPNGGKESSPGMSAAIPWDHAPKKSMRPNGARERACGLGPNVISVPLATILPPLQGAGRWGRHHPGHRVAQPRARISRPLGPMLRTHLAPNGGKESSPGMSNAIPWDHVPPPVMHPEGVRESVGGTMERVIPLRPATILPPLQGAGRWGRHHPGHRVAQPRARLSRPVGPSPCVRLAPNGVREHVDAALSGGIGRLWLPYPRAKVSRPVGPVPQVPPAPNGGKESSPGLSNAMPWDPWDQTPPPSMHPEGVREQARITFPSARSPNPMQNSGQPEREEVRG
jgi:hypothetical protein